MLSDDEVILTSFVVIYHYDKRPDYKTLSLWIITNKRFIITKRNKRTNITTEFPLENIESVSSSLPESFKGLVVIKLKEKDVKIIIGCQNCKIIDAIINDKLSELAIAK